MRLPRSLKKSRLISIQPGSSPATTSTVPPPEAALSGADSAVCSDDDGLVSFDSSDHRQSSDDDRLCKQSQLTSDTLKHNALLHSLGGDGVVDCKGISSGSVMGGESVKEDDDGVISGDQLLKHEDSHHVNQSSSLYINDLEEVAMETDIAATDAASTMLLKHNVIEKRTEISDIPVCATMSTKVSSSEVDSVDDDTASDHRKDVSENISDDTKVADIVVGQLETVVEDDDDDDGSNVPDQDREKTDGDHVVTMSSDLSPDEGLQQAVCQTGLRLQQEFERDDFDSDQQQSVYLANSVDAAPESKSCSKDDTILDSASVNVVHATNDDALSSQVINISHDNHSSQNISNNNHLSHFKCNPAFEPADNVTVLAPLSLISLVASSSFARQLPDKNPTSFRNSASSSSNIFKADPLELSSETTSESYYFHDHLDQSLMTVILSAEHSLLSSLSPKYSVCAQRISDAADPITLSNIVQTSRVGTVSTANCSSSERHSHSSVDSSESELNGRLESREFDDGAERCGDVIVLEEMFAAEQRVLLMMTGHEDRDRFQVNSSFT